MRSRWLALPAAAAAALDQRGFEGVPFDLRGFEPFDLRGFEGEGVERWLETFAIDLNNGRFRYTPSTQTPDLFGAIDAAHVLAAVGQLERLDSDARRRWKTEIDSYQSSDGFYHTPSQSKKTDKRGTIEHWAAAEATAALALIGEVPLFPNVNYTSLLAGGPPAWQSFFAPLVSDACYSKKLEADDFHSCGKIFAAPAAVLAYAGGADDFLRWWVDFLADSPLANTSAAKYACLGGGMATHGAQIGLGGNGALGQLAYPEALLEFALALQDENGLFDEDPGSMSLDGIFQITRSAKQLGTLRSDFRVQGACLKLLRTMTPRLNNNSFLNDHYSVNSHVLPNVVAAVAECAEQFPRLVVTEREWTCCARYV